MPALPSELFTPQSVGTLTGATSAVYVVSSGLQRAFNFNPRWLGLALSLTFALYGTLTTQEPLTVGTVLVGVLNGFLIFATSVRANAITPGGQTDDVVAMGTLERMKGERPSRRFSSKWF